MRKPFGPFSAAIWRKLAATLFDETRMVITPDQVVDNLQFMFSEIEGGKPREMWISVIIAWLGLGGPIFHWGSYEFRKARVAKRFQNSRIDIYQDFARIRGIVYAGYYGHWQGVSEDDNRDNPVLQSLGFTLPTHRHRDGLPDDPEISKPGQSRDLPNHVFVGDDEIPGTVEVVVVGSGAGGAVAAANMADEGYEVLVIEAGRHFPSSRISPHELRMSSQLYKDGAIQTTRNRDIIVFQGRTVGGSTVINNGICLRVKQDGLIHPDANNVVQTWHELGAPVDPAVLDASYQRIESFLGIEEVHKRLGRNNGTHMLRGWQEYLKQTSDPRDIRSVAAWFSKNWGPRSTHWPCASAGYCNTGCPYGRKHAAPEGFLRHATDAARTKPARIMDHAEVLEILWCEDRPENSRKAKAVVLRLADGRKRTVKVTKGVIVAAGTIASSNLLMASDIKGVGKGISLNIACPVAALMPHEVKAWDEDQMATYVDRGDFLLESHFQPPMSMATIVPGWFNRHFDRMLNYNRLASAGVLFPADRRGEIRGGRLDFRLQQSDLKVLRRAMATLTKVHFAAGALEVYPALLRGQTLERGMTHAQIDQFFDDAIAEPDDVVLSSSHPHGGNGINADPARGVVDVDQRVHGTKNVYVTDASVMPSCIRVNAQLTTMAMANRVTQGRRLFG